MAPSAAVAAASAQWAAWWPWVAIAALGLFHGINPAMGWLFAVALGLHRHKRSVVLLSLLPIALGHALAVALLVYDHIGIAFLRTGWINLDLVWSLALALCGVVLLLQ